MNESPSPGQQPMQPSPQPPQTPPAQRARSIEDYFSPEAHFKLDSLKRKTSVLSLSTPAKAAGGYIKWRLLWVKSQVEVMQCTRESLKEAYGSGKMTKEEFDIHRLNTFDEQAVLDEEEKELLSQGRLFEQDLSDSVESAETAYINDIYYSWRLASSEGQGKKQKVLAPNKFNNAVAEYLGAERLLESEAEPQRWCSILGKWINKSLTTCAHIVPKSFDSRELGYIFGAGDAALSSVRNGIVMYRTIETAFDNGWITIVPDGSVESTPTEWKLVLMNDTVKNGTAFTEMDSRGFFKVVHWQDLHNRRLVWQNDNRPARRYLYFRYVMALMHAEFQKWANYRDKVPPGHIWASPCKPDGYLRRSVLRSLARRINDEDFLPEELIDAGGFDDTKPATGIEVNDEVAGLALGMKLTKMCMKKAKKERYKEEEDSDASSED